MSLLYFSSTDGGGKPSPQLIYSFVERSNVICQVQGPGFIRLASTRETLIQTPPGGFNVDRASGIVVFPWKGSLWGIAGGQQAAGLPLVVTANFETSTLVDSSVIPDPLHAPLSMPAGYVPYDPGDEDDYGHLAGPRINPDNKDDPSFTDVLLTYDLSGILKRLFHS